RELQRRGCLVDGILDRRSARSERDEAARENVGLRRPECFVGARTGGGEYPPPPRVEDVDLLFVAGKRRRRSEDLRLRAGQVALQVVVERLVVGIDGAKTVLQEVQLVLKTQRRRKQS